MLTVFAIPKSFRGHIATIQRNAILSWTLLDPACEIILLGNDEGTAEAAGEFGVRHVPNIACNEYGTPLVSDAFEKAQHLAAHDTLCYVNADIILMNDFMQAVDSVLDQKRRFLMVGQRWDVDIQDLWDLSDERQLREYVAEWGELHPPTGSDYFVFPRGTLGELPPFAVGRPKWDNWLIRRARTLGLPVIDASVVATAIHQNHDYSHIPKASDDSRERYGPEADHNRELGSWGYIFTLADATHLLTLQGLKWNQERWRAWRLLYAGPILHPYLCWPLRLLLKAYRVFSSHASSAWSRWIW